MDEKDKQKVDLLNQEPSNYQAPQLLKLEETQPETGGTNVPEGSAGLVS